MWNWRERHLAAEIGRRIAAPQRGEGVGGLVNGRRKQERDEPEDPDGELGFHPFTRPC